MKELSTEQKAERYDEAIEKARCYYDGANGNEDMITMTTIMFPELKESDDDKVRKKLIHLVKKSYERGGYALHKWESDEMLAWLEKQGEQKPADKVEPKFKIGDWVVYNKDICQIVKREEGCNKLVTVFGIEKELVNERNLSTARLWTIKDARDGDVLVIQKTDVTYESIFIFKKIENNCIIQYLHYFTTDSGEEVCEAKSVGGFLGFVGNAVHPATKEQRDTLMKAMAGLGYEWDAEKKELKKIKQKPAWSEEDERNLNDAILFIETGTYSLDKDNLINWLKSLRERVQLQPKQEWKPSDEQMKALHDINLTGGISYAGGRVKH